MKTLVSYAYFETKESYSNLSYFAKHGIFKSQDTFFCIVINGKKCSVEIPEYDNITVIYRDNIGFDFGAHAETLNLLGTEYDYYIFLNSSVIGPFTPVYFSNSWTTIFTDRFTDDIKLVGTSIVCLPDYDAGGYGPRVEGFCFALDQEGLDIVLKTNTVFVQHANKRDTVVNGEYGLSKAILNAGFNLDCLLLKYKGINWKDQSNWNLNNNIHPSRKNSYDGISIHPLEVVFHKWYWSFDPSSLVSYNFVKKYSEWA